MKLYEMKLLSIICEILVKRKIIDILDKHNVSGYTFYEVEGKGEKGVRISGLPEEKNIKIEVILTSKTAEEIIGEISRYLFADYAIILYLSDIQVARIEKFQ